MIPEIESPANVLISDKAGAMQAGAQISHYRIVSRLGAGGMGEVWLAVDEQLGRNVAVKILRPAMAENPDWLRRFIREARAVAALNHPNIAQVHELREHGELRMIVMEYVPGETLTETIKRGPIPLGRILDIGVQVANALEEAHSKGIIHRDVKPGNIMLTPRGQVKVLDFGIAKIPSQTDTGAVTAAAAEAAVDQTLPGEIRGTPRYMSPEQCLGRDIDPRSDLFSFGAVLYEMATDQPAFLGSTSAEVYDSILHANPKAPSLLNHTLPQLFDRLVARALEKDRERRFASAADLRTEIENLIRALQPETRRVVYWPRWLMPASALLLAGLVGAVWYANSNRSAQRPLAVETVPLTTALGTETQPSFSPDGTRVAYAASETEDNWDIFVQQVDSGPPLRLTDNPAIDYSPAWSPDGSTIVFLRQSSAGDSGFYVLPAFGGHERLVTSASNVRTGTDSPYEAWFPDSKALVIADKASPEEPVSLFRLDLITGVRTRLTTPPANTFGDSSPTLSRDGSTVFFVRSQALGLHDIYSIPATGGTPVRLTAENHRIYGMAWNPANDQLIFGAARGKGGVRLWRLAPTGGEPHVVTGVGEGAGFIAIAPKGDKLAFSRATVDSNVWRYDLTGQNPPRRLISSTRHEQGPKYSPDGKRIVFASTRTGHWEIFVCHEDGSGVLQLTTLDDKPAGSPEWAPDGQSIAFDARTEDSPDIFTLRLDGSLPKRLTTDPAQDTAPTYSRDGKWLYFASNRTGRWEVWKMPSGGGEQVQVTRNGGYHAMESLDRTELYYSRSLVEPGLWKMPIGGGAETQVLPKLPGDYWSFWALAPGGIYFVDQEQMADAGIEYSLKFLDFASRQERKVLVLQKRPMNSGLAISSDGRYALYTQVDRADTDIMLVKGFR